MVVKSSIEERKLKFSKLKVKYDIPDTINTSDAAMLLRKDTRTIREYCFMGRIPAKKEKVSSGFNKDDGVWVIDTYFFVDAPGFVDYFDTKSREEKELEKFKKYMGI